MNFIKKKFKYLTYIVKTHVISRFVNKGVFYRIEKISIDVPIL